MIWQPMTINHVNTVERITILLKFLQIPAMNTEIFPVRQSNADFVLHLWIGCVKVIKCVFFFSFYQKNFISSPVYGKRHHFGIKVSIKSRKQGRNAYMGNVLMTKLLTLFKKPEWSATNFMDRNFLWNSVTLFKTSVYFSFFSFFSIFQNFIRFTLKILEICSKKE